MSRYIITAVCGYITLLPLMSYDIITAVCRCIILLPFMSHDITAVCGYFALPGIIEVYH